MSRVRERHVKRLRVQPWITPSIATHGGFRHLGRVEKPLTVRDPVWGNIPLDPAAAAIVDTSLFQRLRRVKQLGFAHLVYPGAVHSRFMHALGVYHLTRRAFESLRRRGALTELDAEENDLVPLITLAALLHDVGHYAFSHAMEEVEPDSIPGHHEEVAGVFLNADPIRTVLNSVARDAPRFVGELIRGQSSHPLQGLISGSLDLDKIDYLKRDAFFCGVPYGSVDVDRLLDAITVARDGDGAAAIAVTEKGIGALESLLFSKYQMFRYVYWHHTARAATVAFRRLVETAVACGLVEREGLLGWTDEELLNLLGRRAAEAKPAPPPIVQQLLSALIERRLPKRAVEMFGDELPAGLAPWVQTHRELVRALEDRLASEWGQEPGTVLVDYPAKLTMLELDVLLVRRNGDIQRLTSAGEKGLIDLPLLSRRLHHTARVFRVFSLERLAPVEPAPILELLQAPAADVAERLSDPRPLY
jgi:HD superfamily phosphohydrolase